MALLNVLQECDLSNAADVAAKLIEEEVGWSDITGGAYARRGDLGVHNLLRDITKSGVRAKIIQYLDEAGTKNDHRSKQEEAQSTQGLARGSRNDEACT